MTEVADIGIARTTTSADGTRIQYFSAGTGADVLVIPGVLSAAEDYAAFVRTLARHFTVHTVQRRGRAGSGPQGESYSIATECADLAAVRAITGADLLFGHSYGGLIALEFAKANPLVAAVAVYEPGVSVNGSISNHWMGACKAAIAASQPLAAFAHFSIGSGPRGARRLPVWAMKALLVISTPRARRHKLFGLLGANLLEHGVISALDNRYPAYGQIAVPTLLMYGGKTRLEWLSQAIKALSSSMPNIQVLKFPQLGHLAPQEACAADVAERLAEFFYSLPTGSSLSARARESRDERYENSHATSFSDQDGRES